MEQYQSLKDRHPGEIVLFRLGDFYEMFYDDAKTAAALLGLTLTSRFKGEKAVPMAGVPRHSVHTYIRRLLAAGKTVALCEQMEDPEEADGVVARDVVRVITPGTLTEDELLEARKPNHLAAAVWSVQQAGLAWLDLSTGRFELEDLPRKDLADELARLAPAECLLPDDLLRSEEPFAATLKAVVPGRSAPAPDWTFERTTARKALLAHFQTTSLSGFGCEEAGLSLGAAGAILEYVAQTQKGALAHITRVARFSRNERLVVDRVTSSALELTETLRGGQKEGSLLGVLDVCSTVMGSRLLREWITAPLRDLASVSARHDAVADAAGDLLGRRDLREALKGIQDLERITARLGSGRGSPRDLAGLSQTLRLIPALRTRAADRKAALLRDVAARMDPCPELVDLLGRALVDDPPAAISDGGVIRPGYDAELDRLRALRSRGKSWMADFQAGEIRRTGIPSLKVGYNRVFGYYIEITRVHDEKIPADYERRQTLKNAERYVTPELKKYEEQVLSAEQQGLELEEELFLAVRAEAARAIPRLQETARAVAALDVLCTLAQVAADHRYVRPKMTDAPVLRLVESRHPVLERISGSPFVPNDAVLDAAGARLILLTGPNMAGKSTFIRQVALCAILAQMGSFVPAREAEIGWVDRVFTRVGAADELARGNSTFMVEMNETAHILHHATDRSLIVLDEIGRGTSTFDGVSIAWAVTEYLHDRVGARTLFATHYHELTELAAFLPGVRNFHVEVKEWGDQVLFVHRIAPGATDKSYGIHVARLAGIPKEVVGRARTVLTELEARLEEAEATPALAGSRKAPKPPVRQLPLFATSKPNPAAEALKKIDVESMTPLQALQKLKELQDMAGGG